MTTTKYLDFTGGSKESDFNALNLRISDYLGLRQGSVTKRWALPEILDSGSTWRMEITDAIFYNVLTIAEQALCGTWDNAIDPKITGLTGTEESYRLGTPSASWDRTDKAAYKYLQQQNGDRILLQNGTDFLVVQSGSSKLLQQDGNRILKQDGYQIITN